MSLDPAARPVLAIAIDAAEPTLVRSMLSNGELPALARLLEEGQWGSVTSPAGIGSGAVWPTFTTGSPPTTHEICSFWTWDPERMAVTPVPLGPIEPLWRAVADRGKGVCLIDVPFTQPGSAPGGCELVEWGAHDAILRRTSVLPRDLARAVPEARASHPFGRRPHDLWARATSAEELAAVAAVCIEGTRLRGALARRLWQDRAPDFMLLTFTEVHRASHMLWPRDLDVARQRDWVRDVYRETDVQIGELLSLAGDASVVVFSLHGMRASAGVPTVLDTLLRASGFAAHAAPPAASTTGVRRLARRLAPPILKRVYRAITPPDRMVRLAGPPDPMPPYDWSRTTAFALPTDQYGWVRVNLRGRERVGIVPPEEYDRTCGAIETALRDARSADGTTLVETVTRTAATTQPPRRLPDLVVHWNTSASPATAAALMLRATNVSGEHSPQGFFIARGAPITQTLGGHVSAELLLGQLLAAAA